MQSDNEKIAFYLTTNVYEVKSKNKKSHSYWNIFNLLPNIDENGEILGSEYYHKALCSLFASGNNQEFKRAYENLRVSEIWEFLTIEKARNYYPE